MAILTVQEMKDLACGVLGAVGVPEDTARLVADELTLAELDGLPSHGMTRLTFYADHVKSGKVLVDARPVVTRPRPGAILVDACHGFAYPAIDIGLREGVAAARKEGTCAVAVRRSHHCGMLGHFVERTAKEGLVGLAFASTPAAMAPWGGSRPVFGTNPIAFGCPRKDDDPIVVDMSLTPVARGKIIIAKQRGESIPTGWARDAQGRDTTDPAEALKGTMLPMGGAKGAALALMVELLAGTLTGSLHGTEASSFFDTQGGPPGVGQFFLLVDPAAFNPDFATRVEDVCRSVLDQEGTRLPGMRRVAGRREREAKGVDVPDALLGELRRRATEGSG
ncbi:MAG: Ldh family oxidoreductase [Desulfovibrio sp.]|jgi:(2R)-3-sulfolactate dehydrogenase (NADP+)|nr:Ldh family oxidoreductase [Desulfovibrio sp.]